MFIMVYNICRKIFINNNKCISRLFSSSICLDSDLDYLSKLQDAEYVKNNMNVRKGVGDINKVLQLYNKLKILQEIDPSFLSTKIELEKELHKLPNRTHPRVLTYNHPYIVHSINDKRHFGDYKPLEFSDITRRLNLMRTEQLGHTCGHKSYYFLGELAELEEALIKYTITCLLKENFTLLSVPDILSSSVLESCGMTVNKDRTQIYSLDHIHHGTDSYLSGTAEMSIAGLLQNTLHKSHDLPMKFTAVSRCYRAETSNVIEERGIYRVHQFTKVEMFTLTAPHQSDDMLEYIRNLQERLFQPLGFHMQVLDMPPCELGASAYRKYDIEAWMPGRNNFGEISSCSNCTDYQSRRLNIKYLNDDKPNYVHTLNGTACAIPRMLIALLETHQDPKGKIFIPEILQPFMNGKKYITKNTAVPELRMLKIKKQ